MYHNLRRVTPSKLQELLEDEDKVMPYPQASVEARLQVGHYWNAVFNQFPSLPPEAHSKLKWLCEMRAEQMRVEFARYNIDIERPDIWIDDFDHCLSIRVELSHFFREAAEQNEAVITYNLDAPAEQTLETTG